MEQLGLSKVILGNNQLMSLILIKKFFIIAIAYQQILQPKEKLANIFLNKKVQYHHKTSFQQKIINKGKWKQQFEQWMTIQGDMNSKAKEEYLILWSHRLAYQKWRWVGQWADRANFKSRMMPGWERSAGWVGVSWIWILVKTWWR